MYVKHKLQEKNNGSFYKILSLGHISLMHHIEKHLFFSNIHSMDISVSILYHCGSFFLSTCTWREWCIHFFWSHDGAQFCSSKILLCLTKVLSLMVVFTTALLYFRWQEYGTKGRPTTAKISSEAREREGLQSYLQIHRPKCKLVSIKRHSPPPDAWDTPR